MAVGQLTGLQVLNLVQSLCTSPSVPVPQYQFQSLCTCPSIPIPSGTVPRARFSSVSFCPGSSVFEGASRSFGGLMTAACVGFAAGREAARRRLGRRAPGRSAGSRFSGSGEVYGEAGGGGGAGEESEGA
eukprot:2893033-Rhodomonas_salina.1